MIKMKEGRPKEVEGDIVSVTHTFYCAPAKWERFKEISTGIGMKASALLRQCIDEVIMKYEGNELQQQKFDLVGKERELLTVKATIQKHFDYLRKDFVGKKSAYDVLVAFAVSFGTDSSLTKNIGDVLDCLINYEFRGTEQFNSSQLLTFILYLKSVLSRRTIEGEINVYLRDGSKIGVVVPM